MGIGRFAIFFVVILVLLVASSFYVGRRAKQAFGFESRVEKGGLLIMLAAIAGMILARTFEIRVLGQIAFTLLLAVLLMTGLLLIVDLIKLVLRFPFFLLNRNRPALAAAKEEKLTVPAEILAVSANAVEHEAIENPAAPPPTVQAEEIKAAPTVIVTPTTRRVFLGQAVTGSAMIVGSGSAFYGAIFGRQDYSFEEISVGISGLSKRLDNYSLVQISDIHFGLYAGEREIRVAEELVKRARADRIVLTGDLLDSSPKYADLLGQLIRRISPLARDGVVVIPGNHDWFAGVDIVMDTARAAGARVLRNEGFVIGDPKDGFAMLGVEDVWAKRYDSRLGPDVDKAISQVPADLPRVLLCHNPSYFPEAAGKVSLQLSGHTHGGQINMGPIRPGKIVLPYGYIEGRYERNGSHLYVNRGFGTAGPPARVGSPPEVTKIVLVSA